MITKAIKTLPGDLSCTDTRKLGDVRAGSTVIVLVFPVHMAIKQTRPHLQSPV
jgi:hypothetical protein